MQAFVRVVEAGSFTKAAETLFMSKTTVTQLIQQLEGRLRVKLLHRTTRSLRMTEDGALYYERALRLLADMEDAEASLPSASTVPQGRLRVDVPTPFARMVLAPALPDFHARYPHIQLDMGVSDRKVDVVSDNVDCVIRGVEVGNDALVARHVGDLRMGAYAAPAYLARVGHPADVQALAGPPHYTVGYLNTRSGKVLPFRARQGAQSVQVEGAYVVAMDDGNAYLAAGLAGMGVLWLPSYMAVPHLAQAQLVPVLQDWVLEPMPMYAAYPRNRHLSRKVRVFIDWVVELMQAQAWEKEGGNPPEEAMASFRE